MPIKVLVADLPQMLSDIVGAVLKDQGDIEVVGRSQGGGQLLADARRTGADVVVTGGRGDELPASFVELLEEFPRVVLLAVSGDGRTATRYRLRPEPVPLGEVSPQSLIDAIRDFVPRAQKADA